MTKVQFGIVAFHPDTNRVARERRLREGYTQPEIAARLNCSPATISVIENGKSSARVLAQRAGRRKEQ
jgi:DNA-binding XRE family transcriptional regulator